MEELYERTQRVVQLGILQGHDVMYVVRVGRQGHQLVASPIAGRIPATCAAIGKQFSLTTENSRKRSSPPGWRGERVTRLLIPR